MLYDLGLPLARPGPEVRPSRSGAERRRGRALSRWQREAVFR